MEHLETMANKEVSLGGIVTGLRKGVSKKGKPYGIVTIEDYSGAGELALFGENWAKFGSYMETPGTTLFITGRVQGKRYAPEEMELSIGNLEFLDNVKDRIIENINIYIPEETINENLVVQIEEAINQNPGNTELYVHFIDAETNVPVRMKRRGKGITVTKKLIGALNDNDIKYEINQ